MLIKEISGITIGLKGSGSIVNEVASQLGFLNQEQKPLDIILEFGEITKDDYQPSIYSAKSVMNFNKNQFFVGYLPGISYLVSKLFSVTDETIHVKISHDKQKSFKKFVKSLLGYNNAGSQVLSYGLFWYLYQIVLLKKGKSFIHGATLVSKNNTLLIAGTGGCGKTSTTLELLSQEKAEYLSEDFSILDREGVFSYNPKPVSIYCSDIEYGSKILKQFNSNLGVGIKLRTFFLRSVLNKNPMFKVQPKKIFKCAAEGNASLSALYFIRTEGGKPKVVDCSLEDFSTRCVDASIREMKTYTELANLILANDTIETGVVGSSELRNRMVKTYMSAFHDKRFKLIYLPINTKPSETVSFLESNGFI